MGPTFLGSFEFSKRNWGAVQLRGGKRLRKTVMGRKDRLLFCLALGLELGNYREGDFS